MPSTNMADRGATPVFAASPKTLAERLRYLLAEAYEILREPGRFDPAAVRWAEDMVASTTLVAGKAAR